MIRLYETTRLLPDYGFIRVGKREARTGMEWVVELGLAEGCPALVQRTAFRNLSPASSRLWSAA